MKIVPSVLTDQLDEFKETLRKAEVFADYVQIDFMDGRFVPSKSISPRDTAGIAAIIGCEAHLMVEQPEQYLKVLKGFGFGRIIFHWEVSSNPRDLIKAIKAEGMEAGAALNPETDARRLDGFVDKLDSVLFMSVNPGFYGSPFIPEVLEKIGGFRKDYPEIVIGIDGGVALDNLQTIKALGVTYACVGSRIFCSDDPAESYKEFERRARAQGGPGLRDG
jgi:ribulose-phosphate 3-epimerase